VERLGTRHQGPSGLIDEREENDPNIQKQIPKLILKGCRILHPVDEDVLHQNDSVKEK
jgi:hypothetical protein